VTVAQHTYSAALVAGGVTYPLTLKAGTVTMDDGRAPHVSARLTVPTSTAALQELIDPRTAARVLVTASVSYAAFNTDPPPATARTFDLHLRARDIAHNNRETTLELASDEALLIDDVLRAHFPSTGGQTRAASLRNIVEWILARIGATLQSGRGDYDFSAADPESLLWEPGTSAWDYLEPLLRAAALRLFCDDRRRWHLVDDSYVIDDLLEVIAGVNITDATDTLSRDTEDWYDAALFRYSWTDAAGESHVVYDYAERPGATRTRTFEVERPYPGAGAADYALQRATGKGRAITLTALSDYSTQPTRLIFATFPDRPLQTGFVASVTWDITSDEMSVTTRGLGDTPPNAWILAPLGYRWLDSPLGASWAEYLTPEED